VIKLKPGQIWGDTYPSGLVDYFKLIRIEDTQFYDCYNRVTHSRRMWRVYSWDPRTRSWQGENSSVISYKGIGHIKESCRKLSKLEGLIRFGPIESLEKTSE